MLLLSIIHVISVVCLLCFPALLFIAALWSPVGKGLTSWLSFVMSNCEFVTFPLIGILGQLWYSIVSILDLCPLLYFECCTISGLGLTGKLNMHLESMNATIIIWFSPI